MWKPITMLCLAAGALAGCGTKEDAKPGSSFTGKVQLTDEFGKPQADQSGVLVSVANTTPQLTAQTAADGTYTLANVPDGTHPLSFSKTGYGTYITPAIATDPHQEKKIDACTLGQVSTTLASVTSYFEIKYTTGNKFDDIYLLIGKVSPAPTVAQPRPHRLFLQSLEPNLIGGPVATHYNLSVRGYTRPDGSFIDTVTVMQLRTSLLIQSGAMQVKVWATGDNPSASVYFNEGSNRIIFPAANLALNPSTFTFYTAY